MKIRGFLLLQLGLLCLSMGQSKPKLYVFVPSNVRPNNMERFISDSCTQLQIQVFGRHRELRKGVEVAPPDAILAPDPVLTSGLYEGYRAALVGSRANATEEKYVLLSVGQKVEIREIPELAIGAVDLLGRRDMMTFITGVLGQKPRKFEPVTKHEELLTILQFQDVDAIFVPEQLVDSYYKERSKMDLIRTEVPTRIGLPRLSTSATDPEKLKLLKACLNGLSAGLNGKLGVEHWVSP